MIDVSRRRLLGVALFGGLAAKVPAVGSAPRDPDPLVATLLELVRDEAAAGDLGRRYLLALGNTPQRTVLAARIVPESERAGWLALALEQRRALLARRVSADFGSRRVVEIDGWLLAESEATLCGIVACPPTRA